MEFLDNLFKKWEFRLQIWVTRWVNIMGVQKGVDPRKCLINLLRFLETDSMWKAHHFLVLDLN